MVGLLTFYVAVMSTVELALDCACYQG